MGQPLDLEALRKVFEDNKTHIAVAKVLQVELASDRSVLLAQCDILTQDRKVIAKVTWDSIGDGGGFVQFPQADDLVLLAIAEGDDEQCFVIKRLSSNVDKIPAKATGGDTVVQALAGKKLHLLSDTKILLGKGAADPMEPLVLGNVLLNALTDIINAFLNAPQVGLTAFGPAFLDPTLRTALMQAKTTYVTNASTNVVSQIGFTERGN